MSIRYPASLEIILGRVWRLELLMACIQLFHLIVLSNAGSDVLLVWLFVHSVALLSLWILRSANPNAPSFLRIPWRPLLLILSVSLLFKLSSRAPIIAVWITDGLRATRDSEELAGGSGLASYANIFFYPISILLAFTTMPKRAYLAAFLCVALVCCVDLVVLGTRNAPVFVLLFHLLNLRVHFGPKRLFVFGLLAIGFVSIFSYSTINRTLEGAQADFDWLELFEWTNSTEVLPLRGATVEAAARAAPELVPAIFLSHYLTHSVAELQYLFSARDGLTFGTAAYLVDQACGIGVCSREESQGEIMSVNPRAGAYQTIWGSMLFDFGMVGTVIVWILGIFSVVVLRITRLRISVLAVALASVVVVLGMVENYLYNGLGLAQVLTIALAYGLTKLLSHGRERPSA